jgi:adenylate cyclase
MPGPLALLQRQIRELRRRRVFRTLAAYAVGGWLLLQVADTTFEPLGFPPWMQRALIITVFAGVVPVAILSWIFDLQRGRLVRTPNEMRGLDGPGAGIALPQAVVAGPMSGIASVAILPFSDLSQAQDQSWFCDGLAEEIIDSLCCVRGLRVASRTASFRFRDGKTDPREIGRQLGVDAILEGSVRKSDDRVRVSAQLIDAETGYQRWGESYERQLQDIFVIQADIATHVAEALRLNLADPALARNQRYAPANMEAYEYYLRGRQAVNQISERSLRHAVTLFRRAVELQPDYPQALAGLTDILVLLIQWRFEPASSLLPEAAAAAAKALDLAPDLAEAQVAQGNVRSLAGDDEGALRAFDRAIALNPGLFEAWYYYGRHCYSQGRPARAAEMLQEAWRLRPDEPSVLALAVSALDASGSKDGDAVARRALEGLRKQMDLEPDNVRARYMAAGLMLRLGQREASLALAEQALALQPDEFSTLYNVACTYSLAGEHERALDLLERALARGGFVDWMVHDPDIAAVRDTPRFQAMMRNLAEARPQT